VTKRKWLRESEQRAWLGWMGASRLVDLSLDQQLRRDSGMSHATYSLMAVLSKAPQRTLRMADIAMMTNSSQSRLSHAVDRVEESGWITRRGRLQGAGGNCFWARQGTAGLAVAATGWSAAITLRL
jgi:hypothetical protein